jgi:hypothetical protein
MQATAYSLWQTRNSTIETRLKHTRTLDTHTLYASVTPCQTQGVTQTQARSHPQDKPSVVWLCHGAAFYGATTFSP